jgi:hypothetical protein
MFEGGDSWSFGNNLYLSKTSLVFNLFYRYITFMFCWQLVSPYKIVMEVAIVRSNERVELEIL